jgi:uncharacterized protein YjbI with pentapeptide repeats
VNVLRRKLTDAGYGDYFEQIEGLLQGGEIQQAVEILMTILEPAPLRNVDVSPDLLNGQKLKDLDLRGMRVERVSPTENMRNVTFYNCDLSGSSFEGLWDEDEDSYFTLSMRGVVFDSCNLTGVEFAGVRPNVVELRNCYVSDPKKPVEFVDSKFSSTTQGALMITGKPIFIRFTAPRAKKHPVILMSENVFEAKHRTVRTDTAIELVEMRDR